jgi:hypothetical protein
MHATVPQYSVGILSLPVCATMTWISLLLTGMISWEKQLSEIQSDRVKKITTLAISLQCMSMHLSRSDVVDRSD